MTDTEAREPYRYMVTLNPNVSIAPRRFVEVVEVDGPQPFTAIAKAIAIWEKRETHMWQSSDATIKVERVA
jgi:hypothetical protein